MSKSKSNSKIVKETSVAPVKEETDPPKPAETTNDVPQPKESFNPLSETVNEKSYSGAGADGTTVYSDIPEPSYQRPPDEGSDIPEREIGAKEKKQQDKPKATANPDLQNSTEREKQEGAAAMTDVLLTTWEQLYKGANQLFKISEKTVNKLQQAGQIDTRVEVPYKMGVAPLSTIFTDYNNDADGLLILEPEFKEEIHPLITEELAKAGHGMSNRQKLMYLVSTKLMADGFKAYQFISLKRDYLKFAKEQTTNGKRKLKVVPDQQLEATPQPVYNPEEHVQEQDIIIDPTEGMTLQEKALHKHVPNGINNSPNFGNNGRLNRMQKESAKDRVVVKTTQKKKSTAKQHIDKAKTTVQHDPPPTGKKSTGRGRPKGAKNKKK